MKANFDKVGRREEREKGRVGRKRERKEKKRNSEETGLRRYERERDK